MGQEHEADAPEPIKPTPLVASAEMSDAPSADPSTGGAKLFVIFFLTLVPLIGMALLAIVIYSLLMR